MKLSKLLHHPMQAIILTGCLSLVVGTLYFPTFPWYILGNVKKSEIGMWGLFAMAGGSAAIIGALCLAVPYRGIRKVLLLIALVGMVVIILAQIPAYFSWLMYGSSFTKQWMPVSYVGVLIGLTMHTLINISAFTSIIAIGKSLSDPASEVRLHLGNVLAFIGILALLIGSWIGYDKYKNANWMASTSPADGAVDVPLDTNITANWKGSRHNNMGMRVRYADEPSRYIPGGTGASGGGMFFDPEQPLEHGRKLTITVEAGRRTYTFTFTTTSK